MSEIITAIIASLVVAITSLAGIIRMLGRKNPNNSNFLIQNTKDHTEIKSKLDEIIRTLERIEEKLR